MAICKFKPPYAIQRGIALIEVMVAIVVLATGILALTILQLSMTRAASEAKTRSIGMGYAQQELERIRGEAGVLANYTSLTDSAAAEIAGSGAVTGTIFFRRVEVQRYTKSTSSPFSPTAPGFALNTTSDVASPVPDIAVPEFKQLQVEVTWIGADAVAQSVSAFDIVDELAFSGSNNLLAENTAGGSGHPVIIQSKSVTGMDGTGVIPIATGGAGGEATAASNPKPLVDNTTGTAATSFNVLTYLDPNTGNIKIQRQVETQMLSCKCQFNATASTNVLDRTKMRPTAWDGTFYATPLTLAASGIPVSDVPDASSTSQEIYDTGVSDRGNPVLATLPVTQSTLCDSCCRDHHDPSSVGTKDKFDPYLPARVTHVQYGYPRNTSGNTTSPVLVSPSDPVSRITGQKPVYVEACRMIRVDGLWRTATDLNLEHMGLLATNQTTISRTAPAYAPTTASVTNYGNFVKAYLGRRVIDGSVTPNTATAGVIADPSTLESTNAINNPATIYLTTDTSTRKYLHDRGLYLDYLNDTTVTYLNQLLKDCPVTDPVTPKINCILAYLPFVTINTTELATWTDTPTSPRLIQINNNPLDANDFATPQRGVVQPTGDAANGLSASGYPNMYRSNSGLVFALPIDQYDGMVDPSTSALYYAGQRRQDSQAFLFSASGSPDADGDGVPDENDNCPRDANPDQLNSELPTPDALGNACDTDDDNDTILDLAPDNCPLVSNLSQVDTDRDGIGDACDPSPDMDLDGVLDGYDNCPFVANPRQEDIVLPGGPGDACDTSLDLDGDGILNLVDNCRLIGNPTQVDSDGDGVGDVCDVVGATYPSLTYTVKLTATAQAFKSNAAPTMTWTSNPANALAGGTCATLGLLPLTYDCLATNSVSQRLKVSGYNQILVTTSNSDLITNPCQYQTGSSPAITHGSNKINQVKCVLYGHSSLAVSPSRTGAPFAASPSSGSAFTGIGGEAAITSSFPTNNAYVNYDILGIRSLDIYSAAFTSREYIMSNVNSPVSYTCSRSGATDGLPVYDFSTCR